MSMDTEKVRSRYDRISGLYDLYELPMELLFFRRWRKLAVSRLKRGRVLEVGAGTGKNLPYYTAGSEVLATDISERMLARARERAKGLGMDVEIKRMDAQRLESPDNHFDSTLSTFVFCSVPDPVLGLMELKRVLKKDGRAVFLEHVRPRGILGKVFDLVNPIPLRLTGTNINRTTVENMKKAGLEILEEKDLLLDIFKLIVAEPGKRTQKG